MQEKIKYSIKDSILGCVLIAQSEKGICAILIGDKSIPLLDNLRDRFSKAYILPGDVHLEKLAYKIVKFIESPKDILDIPLDIRGTDFQKKVWAALQKIPAGKTASYTKIAHSLNSFAIRAVASACAVNPLAVVIPCHRVIRSNGVLSGYRWGRECKKKLLEIEGVR